MPKGIIGFFDILGYQSFLENNSDAEASAVLSQIDELPLQIRGDVTKGLSHYHGERAVELVDLVHWRVFSDSVVLFADLEESQIGWRVNKWIVMHFLCIRLWRWMFECGLPLRGVLHTGEFVFGRSCFAGRAVAEAYRYSQQLDLAAAAYSPEAFGALDEAARGQFGKDFLCPWIPTTTFEYLIPLKCGAQRWRVLNPLAMLSHTQEQYGADLRHLVYEAFSKHRKDVPSEVQTKLTNTELYLRRCQLLMQDFKRLSTANAAAQDDAK